MINSTINFIKILLKWAFFAISGILSSGTMSKADSKAIHWFRKGLRLHDNPALMEACKSASTVYPLFVLDPKFCQGQMNVNRHSFLLQSLTDLDNNLRKVGSRLFVVHGKPEEQVPLLAKKWDVNLVTFEACSGPYSKIRDEQVERALKEMKIKTSSHETHTLFELQRYIDHAGKNPPKTYAAFGALFNSLGKVRQPIPAPTADDFPVAVKLEGSQYEVPSLIDIGYPCTDIPTATEVFPGGETEGLKRLREKVTGRPKWTAEFEKPSTAPNSLEPSTTVLGPYLTMGCVSAASFYHEVEKCYKQFPKHAQPPMSLHGQLLWREFFYLCSVNTPNHDKMIGNPQCKQIPWRRDGAMVEAWKQGQTGFPFIDALMTQLKVQGWIHHLGRHAVACFLTRGDLWQHWEEGARVFELELLDGDWAINNANWQWLSCSRYFYQFGRCYSPIAFGKKTDPSGAYIRKWLPKLKNYPDKYIYEPWTAPMEVQRRAGCVVGEGYPRPLVDHAAVSKENMGKLKAAYDLQKEGGELIMPDPVPLDDAVAQALSTSSSFSFSSTSSKPIDSFFTKKKKS